MKRKPPAVRSIGIDRDAQALEAVARDCPVELVHGCVHASLASVQFTGPGCSTSRPRRVHRTSCAGRNFTDRQRIKRKVANRGRRYEALTADERLAVPVGHVGSPKQWTRDGVVQTRGSSRPCQGLRLSAGVSRPLNFRNASVRAIREWGRRLLRLTTAIQQATRLCANASPRSSGARRLTAPPPASHLPVTERNPEGKRRPARKGTTLARTECPNHAPIATNAAPSQESSSRTT